MESVLKMDIFFFISSISIIVITVIFIVVGFYLIKTMKNFSQISESIKNTVEGTTTSLEEIGDHIKESPIFSFFFGKKRKKK